MNTQLFHFVKRYVNVFKGLVIISDLSHEIKIVHVTLRSFNNYNLVLLTQINQ